MRNLLRIQFGGKEHENKIFSSCSFPCANARDGGLRKPASPAGAAGAGSRESPTERARQHCAPSWINEGWSRIQLSDGSTVYVSNKYLSTTKPVVQQQQTSKSSGGSTTTQQQTGGTQQQPSTDNGQQTEQQTGNKDGWDQAFYDTLTPEQKEIYENLPDASGRNMMKQNIENRRQRESEGWTTDFGDPTEEDLKNAWGNIQLG